METTIESKIKSFVYEKYGWNTVLEAIRIAEIQYWRTLHNMLIGSDKLDESIGIDIQEPLLAASIEYVYQNDRDLQDELDSILEDMGL